MSQLRLAVIISLIILPGCTATLMNYQPSVGMTTREALVAVENSINTNPDKRGISLDFANERFMRLRGRLPGGVTQKNLPYRFMDQITLHTKRDWFIVSIINQYDILEYRYISESEEDAKQLIDGLNTLKHHTPSQYDKGMLQVSLGGEVSTIPSRAELVELKAENLKLKQELEFIKKTEILEGIKPKNRLLTWEDKGISVKHDDFEGITWYKDLIGEGEYKTRLETYFGEKNSGNRWLMMKLRYFASDWLYIHSYTILVDGKKFVFDNRNFNRDHDSASIWEWETIEVGKKEIEMLKRIVKSDKAVIRFYGRQYYNDHTISEEEKDGIRRILAAYYG